MAKKSVRKRKPATSRVTKIVLPPSQPAGSIPCGRDLKWARISVGPDGVLTAPPALLRACTGDVVTWVVTNSSGRPLKVRLKDFQKRATGRAFSPIRWFQDAMPVAHGSAATITGEVVYLPAKGADAELVKYTIEVRGPAAIDYDPDLEIRRPPS